MLSTPRPGSKPNTRKDEELDVSKHNQLSGKRKDDGGDRTPLGPLAPAAKVHPAAQAFPEMTAAELQELADDIKQTGLAHPVVRDAHGIILDGRNRLKACEIAGVEPRFETYRGDNPVGFVVSSNLKRRHLNTSQRAMVAAARAALLNVSERSVKDAAVVRSSGQPEIISLVERGELSVSAAANRIRKPEPEAALTPIGIADITRPFARVQRAAAAGDAELLQAELRTLMQAVTRRLEEAGE